VGRVWLPRIRRQGQHRKLRHRVAELEQQAARSLEEVTRLRERIVLAEAGAVPAEGVPDVLMAAIAASARWVELPGCVALLSCGHNNPCQGAEVWEAVQRVTAAPQPAGEGVTGLRREPLPPGLRGVVTGTGVITICTDMPRDSQKAAASEARVHGVRHGWLPGSVRTAGAIAAVSAIARKPALVLLAAGGAIGGAAFIAVALAPCPSVLRPVQSVSPAAQAPAVIAVPHAHRRREAAARPSPRPRAASATPAPSPAPAAALQGALPAVVRTVLPVPLPSGRPSPLVCVRVLGVHACVPAAA
jgi:hypothetical protein